MTAHQGTVKWMAPEILSNGRYTTKADIYSFGLVAWETFAEEQIFSELRFDSMVEIEVVNNGKRPPLTEKIPEQMKDLISRCWDANPTHRPTATEILQQMRMVSTPRCE